MTRRLELPEPAPAPFFARRPSYPWLVVGAVCIGNFMGQTDASIVQLAMPAFEDAFDAPLDAVSWVAVGYVLAFASVLPAFARLAEIAGRKTLYLAGFALFGLCSAFCALSPGLAWLILFRVLLGAGGAMMGANSVVIIVAAAGAERRGKALGLQAAAQAVGLGIGPALGGVLLGAFGWRSIFWGPRSLRRSSASPSPGSSCQKRRNSPRIAGSTPPARFCWRPRWRRSSW